MHNNLTNVAESVSFLVKYFNSVREKTRWDIYYIYGVPSGYIQRYSRLNLGFFRPRQKNSLGQGRALGNFLASAGHSAVIVRVNFLFVFI